MIACYHCSENNRSTFDNLMLLREHLISKHLNHPNVGRHQCKRCNERFLYERCFVGHRAECYGESSDEVPIYKRNVSYSQKWDDEADGLLSENFKLHFQKEGAFEKNAADSQSAGSPVKKSTSNQAVSVNNNAEQPVASNPDITNVPKSSDMISWFSWDLNGVPMTLKVNGNIPLPDNGSWVKGLSAPSFPTMPSPTGPSFAETLLAYSNLTATKSRGKPRVVPGSEQSDNISTGTPGFAFCTNLIKSEPTQSADNPADESSTRAINLNETKPKINGDLERMKEQSNRLRVMTNQSDCHPQALEEKPDGPNLHPTFSVHSSQDSDIADVSEPLACDLLPASKVVNENSSARPRTISYASVSSDSNSLDFEITETIFASPQNSGSSSSGRKRKAKKVRGGSKPVCVTLESGDAPAFKKPVVHSSTDNIE